MYSEILGSNLIEFSVYIKPGSLKYLSLHVKTLYLTSKAMKYISTVSH